MSYRYEIYWFKSGTFTKEGGGNSNVSDTFFPSTKLIIIINSGLIWATSRPRRNLVTEPYSRSADDNYSESTVVPNISIMM